MIRYYIIFETILYLGTNNDGYKEERHTERTKPLCLRNIKFVKFSVLKLK